MIEILTVFGIEPKMMLIQAINFGIVLVALTYFLYKPLTAMIEKRRADTIEAVANNERAENAAREADTKKKEILSKANLEAESIVETARKHAKDKEAEIVKTASEKGSAILSDAEARGEELKRTYINESKEEIAKMVVLGVEKIIRQS